MAFNLLLQITKSYVVDFSYDFKEKKREVDWLDLPDHVLLVITDRLVNIEDYIRFGAVCRSWQCVYTYNKHWHRCHLPCQLPMLMIPNRCFYSICDKKTHNFPSPFIDKCCRSSSEGWLVTVHNMSAVHLINPFLSVDNVIELPPLTTFELAPGDAISNDYYLKKVVLSANPACDSNYVVMAIHGGHYKLAFFKPGNKEWTSVTNYYLFEDVIYNKDKFYCVNYYGDVFCCDVDGPHPSVWKLAKPPPTSVQDLRKRYIVESNGDFLQVIRTTEDEGPIYYTTGFIVFKLDPDAAKWTEMKSLCGRMLFLGENSSISLLAADFPGCKPNSIYFTDDYLAGYATDPDAPRDIGVFNIEYGSIEYEPHYAAIGCKTIFPPPIWILPTL